MRTSMVAGRQQGPGLEERSHVPAVGLCLHPAWPCRWHYRYATAQHKALLFTPRPPPLTAHGRPSRAAAAPPPC